MGYSPWGHKESDTTEGLNRHLFKGPVFKHTHILYHCVLRLQPLETEGLHCRQILYQLSYQGNLKMGDTHLQFSL